MKTKNFYDYCVESNNITLLNEWSNLNGALSPKAVLENSTAKVWWQCDKGHCWQDSVKNRIENPNCPICTPISQKSLVQGTPRTDLVGRKFGKLTVISYEGIMKESLWKCKCDCGNETVVVQSNLTSGKTTSCGCKRDIVRRENFTKNIHFVDGTCIEKIAAKVTPSNNTSGFRGVYKRGEKWRVSLTFKGKRYNLGTYNDFDAAVAARVAGEQMIDDFVEAYEKENGH